MNTNAPPPDHTTAALQIVKKLPEHHTLPVSLRRVQVSPTADAQSLVLAYASEGPGFGDTARIFVEARIDDIMADGVDIVREAVDRVLDRQVRAAVAAIHRYAPGPEAQIGQLDEPDDGTGLAPATEESKALRATAARQVAREGQPRAMSAGKQTEADVLRAIQSAPLNLKAGLLGIKSAALVDDWLVVMVAGRWSPPESAPGAALRGGDVCELRIPRRYLPEQLDASDLVAALEHHLADALIERSATMTAAKEVPPPANMTTELAKALEGTGSTPATVAADLKTLQRHNREHNDHLSAMGFRWSAETGEQGEGDRVTLSHPDQASYAGAGSDPVEAALQLLGYYRELLGKRDLEINALREAVASTAPDAVARQVDGGIGVPTAPVKDVPEGMVAVTERDADGKVVAGGVVPKAESKKKGSDK